MSLTDIMSHSGLSIFAEIGMILFFITFLGIAWWVYRPANRARWSADARLPLDDGLASSPTQREE
ncbi:MAG: cbb3-type cytochrome c oxidase subunit 3 [Gemmatimonadota bacterium]